MEEFTVDALGEWEGEGGAPAKSEAGSSPTPPTTNAAGAVLPHTPLGALMGFYPVTACRWLVRISLLVLTYLILAQGGVKTWFYRRHALL